MSAASSFSIRFSGIVIRFHLPDAIEVPKEFEALRCGDTAVPDAEYEVQLLHTPLCPDTLPVRTPNGTQIYQTKEGWLHIYSALIAADGCQVALLLRPDGRNILYYPASRWDFYSHPLRCTHLIAGEALLLKHDAFLLHSSVVQLNGKTVLFSGPSGAGKSTQASLWQHHLGADVLNGDRCVVMKKEDGFYGGGSLWCGSSGIYRKEQAPIAGIFLVNQAPENRLKRLGFEAFQPLLTQTTVNSWDSTFMDKLLNLYSQLLDQVPVYRLDCRADREAAELVYRTLF